MKVKREIASIPVRSASETCRCSAHFRRRTSDAATLTAAAVGYCRRRVDQARKEHAAANDPEQEIRHLIEKTNL